MTVSFYNVPSISAIVKAEALPLFIPKKKFNEVLVIDTDGEDETDPYEPSDPVTSDTTALLNRLLDDMGEDEDTDQQIVRSILATIVDTIEEVSDVWDMKIETSSPLFRAQRPVLEIIELSDDE